MTVPSSLTTGMIDRLDHHFLDGAGGTLLAFEREGIQRFTADPFHRRDGIGAQALMRLGMTLLQPLISPIRFRAT